MNKKLKKIVSAAVASAMMLTTAATSLCLTSFADDTAISAPAGKSYKITSKNVTWYESTIYNKHKAHVYFVNGTDIPYIEVNDFISVFSQLQDDNDVMDYKISKSAKGDTYTLTRETGYSCTLDFAADTICFEDYNEFFRTSPYMNLVDCQYFDLRDDDGNVLFIKRSGKTKNERYGDAITLDLGSYGIDLVHSGKGYYLPLQTVNDIFLINSSSALLYNGKSVFLSDTEGAVFGSYKGLTALGELYYKNSIKKFSKAFARYNYAELCLVLDTFYGLKKQHNISSFDALLDNTGLKTELLSGNPARMEAAVYRLITGYMDDQHSSYELPGYASDISIVPKLENKYGYGISYETSIGNLDTFMNARKKFYPDGVPGYEEVGDTAFITFDEFDTKLYLETVDFYTTAPDNDSSDTIGLISYSVQQILRKDSPVKNVVLDLSCNGGGAVDTAFYTIAAFLGKATISLEDTMTGALVTSVYYVDTNLDKKFTSKDYLAGKGLNLYCLISDCSFSCGNLVPCMFKQSPEASLIGQTSGGGACVVLSLSTASGTFFRTSGTTRISFMKNGSFYDVDQGAAPDYPLSKIESFYDREKLVEYINTLL